MSYTGLRGVWSLATSYYMIPWESFRGEIAPQRWFPLEASLPPVPGSLELKTI